MGNVTKFMVVFFSDWLTDRPYNQHDLSRMSEDARSWKVSIKHDSWIVTLNSNCQFVKWRGFTTNRHDYSSQIQMLLKKTKKFSDLFNRMTTVLMLMFVSATFKLKIFSNCNFSHNVEFLVESWLQDHAKEAKKGSMWFNHKYRKLGSVVERKKYNLFKRLNVNFYILTGAKIFLMWVVNTCKKYFKRHKLTKIEFRNHVFRFEVSFT